MEIAIVDERYRRLIQEQYNRVYSQNLALNYVYETKYQDIQQKLKGAINIGKYLSNLSKGEQYIHPPSFSNQTLTNFSRSENPQLVLQSVWALTQTKYPMWDRFDDRVIALFLDLMKHNDKAVVRKTMQCLCIFNDRDGKMIERGALDFLIEFLEKTINDQRTLKIATKLFFHLCRRRYKNQDINKRNLQLLTLKGKLLFYYKLSNTEWLHSISMKCNTYLNIEKMFENGTVEFILSLLYSKSQQVVKICLYIIQNILSKRKNFVARLIKMDLIIHIERIVIDWNSKRLIIDYVAQIFKQLIFSKNLQERQQIASTKVAIELVSAFIQKQHTPNREKIKILALMVPLLNLQSLFWLLHQKKPFHLTSICAYFKRHVSIDAIQDLTIVLNIGDQFRQNGKNMLVERLRENDMILALQKHMCRQDEEVANYIAILLERFL